MKSFFTTTVNSEMLGSHIVLQEPTIQEGSDIYAQTLAVNAEKHTLSSFKKRYSTGERKNMLRSFVDPECDWTDSFTTMKELEDAFKAKLA